MSKTWLLSCVTVAASLGIVLPASAGGPTTVPGTLVIPDATITLYPSGPTTPECAGVSEGQDHSGRMCSARVDATTEVEPYAGDLTALVEGVTTALAAYDVNVTAVVPPKYVPFTLLLPNDAVSAESLSFTCSSAGMDCSAANRRKIGFTSGGTDNCDTPDPIQVALYTFGRMSGLEGVADATDYMFYPPDFTGTAPTGFQDACSDISYQFTFDKEGVPIPGTDTECAAIIDHPECDKADPAQQNTHQALLATYGAALAEADAEAPTIAITTPAADEVITAEGGAAEVTLDATVTDNVDTFVGAMWVLESPALVSDDLPDGVIEYCTNSACRLLGADSGWDEALAVKATDSSFAFGLTLPAGAYTATFYASDLHGNVAEPQTINFTVDGGGAGTGGGSADDTGGPDDTAGPDDGGMFTTVDMLDSGSGDGSATDTDSGGENTDDSGCSCTSGAGGSGLMIFGLGLLGLGLGRGRRRARD